MIVLGIDGSYAQTGFSVVSTDGLPGAERVLHTCLGKTKKADGSDAARCAKLVMQAVKLAQQHGVELVGIEQPYIDRERKHGKVAMRLAALASAFEIALIGAGFVVVHVNTGSVGKALGVRGRNVQRGDKKAQSLACVANRYALDVTDDEADAIGVALAAYRNHQKSMQGKQLEIRFPGLKRRAKKPAR